MVIFHSYVKRLPEGTHLANVLPAHLPSTGTPGIPGIQMHHPTIPDAVFTHKRANSVLEVLVCHAQVVQGLRFGNSCWDFCSKMNRKHLTADGFSNDLASNFSAEVLHSIVCFEVKIYWNSMDWRATYIWGCPTGSPLNYFWGAFCFAQKDGKPFTLNSPLS